MRGRDSARPGPSKRRRVGGIAEGVVSACLFFLERFLKRRDWSSRRASGFWPRSVPRGDWDDGLAGSGLLYQSRDELQGKLYSVVT